MIVTYRPPFSNRIFAVQIPLGNRPDTIENYPSPSRDNIRSSTDFGRLKRQLRYKVATS